jgi:hypothetical protein
MDTRSQELIQYLLEATDYPEVSGFELLEVLDIRSRLAPREPLLIGDDRDLLEKVDKRLLQMADVLLERISEVANLCEMRHRSHILPSHWWWYLDEISLSKSKVGDTSRQ